MMAEKLSRWRGGLVKLGVETGSMTRRLAGDLQAQGLPVVAMDAPGLGRPRHPRPVKTDRGDAGAVAAMLQTGWYRQVFVRSEDSHGPKAPLPSRDQLAKMKRRLSGRIRGSRLRKLVVERDLAIGLTKEAAAKKG